MNMTLTVRTPEERANDDVRLAMPDDARAAGQARRLVRSTLERWGLSSLVEDAELAVSELVTNAFRHGLPPVVLTLSQRVGTVRIDVSDTRPMTVTVELATPGDTDESGRGRGIIAAVSDHSGTDAIKGDGKSSYASWDTT